MWNVVQDPEGAYEIKGPIRKRKRLTVSVHELLGGQPLAWPLARSSGEGSMPTIVSVGSAELSASSARPVPEPTSRTDRMPKNLIAEIMKASANACSSSALTWRRS